MQVKGRETRGPHALLSEKEPRFETGASDRKAFETKWTIDPWRGGDEFASSTPRPSGAVRTEVHVDLGGRGKCQGENKP